MPKVSKFFKVFFPLILASIAIFLCVRNYTPGTYLIGWDSMHPEFNFSLNAARMFSHVWASEQGVGAISAHSDMGDLPRIIFLWISSLVLPASFIRYFYIFLCLIIGPLGMYFFLKYVFQREKDSFWVYPAAFLGGMFYLLNLGTLQNFYVPLEMFTVAFAGVPWLFLTGLKYLREGGKLRLILFALASILIAPMAYAATQAYAIYLGLFLFLFVFSLVSSGKKTKLKRFLILGIVTLFLNLFWIMPNVYSVLQQSLTISNANINRLFSQESFLRNADYGNLANVALQKSFLFSWRNFDFSTNSFTDLLGVWNNHLASNYVVYAGYGAAILVVLGLFFSIFKKDKVGISLILPLVVCLFFLMNVNPPMGGAYKYLYDHFSVFREGFRTPFTKFSVLFEFILAFYLGYFTYLILNIKTKILKPVLAFVKSIFVLAIISGIAYFCLPAFRGELIGKNVRVAIPPEYNELFAWFKSHSEGRVALVPLHSKYGWEYRAWGYEGSGFLTYGIPNPVLYRDFDRWNSSNEDFYNQAAFALYANDTQAFTSTLKKYNVRYLLIDTSIINAGASNDVLKIPEILNIADSSGWKKVAQFGFLSVFDTGFGAETLATPGTFTKVNPNLTYSPVDPVYKMGGDYITSGNLAYPFISLDKRSGVEIKVNDGSVAFENAEFGSSVSLPATESAKINLSVNQGFDTAYNCDLKKLGSVTKEITPTGILYKASNAGVSCDFLSLSDLEYSKGYVLHITGKNISGRSLKFYLFDSANKLPFMEEILPAGDFDENYFIYPRNLDGKGYTLNFETRSFGRIPSENLLTGVETIPVDYSYLESYKTASQEPETVPNNLKILNVQKIGSLIYKVKVEGGGLLTLGQGYEKGWVALQLPINNFQFSILEHTKVNSWAKGWIVPSTINNQNSIIYIFFWPQALEWGGMVVGIAAFLIIILKRKIK